MRRDGARRILDCLQLSELYAASAAAGSQRFQVSGGRLAAIRRHDVILDFLAFREVRKPRLFDGADVHEHILPAVRRLNKPISLLGVEPLYGT
jgi:hypothetical protein